MALMYAAASTNHADPCQDLGVKIKTNHMRRQRLFIQTRCSKAVGHCHSCFSRDSKAGRRVGKLMVYSVWRLGELDMGSVEAGHPK